MEGYVHQSADAHRGQKRQFYPMDLELKASVGHLPWVLGIQPRSSAAEVLSLIHRASSPAPHLVPSPAGFVFLL